MKNQFIFSLAILCCLITFTAAGCITCTPPNKMDVDGFCSECIDCVVESDSKPWLLGVIVGVPSGVGLTGLVIYTVKSQLLKRARIKPTGSSPRRSQRDQFSTRNSGRTHIRHRRLDNDSPSLTPNSTPDARTSSFDLVLENIE